MPLMPQRPALLQSFQALSRAGDEAVRTRERGAARWVPYLLRYPLGRCRLASAARRADLPPPLHPREGCHPPTRQVASEPTSPITSPTTGSANISRIRHRYVRKVQGVPSYSEPKGCKGWQRLLARSTPAGCSLWRSLLTGVVRYDNIHASGHHRWRTQRGEESGSHGGT